MIAQAAGRPARRLDSKKPGNSKFLEPSSILASQLSDAYV
jgi:hypothetical protein